MVGTWKLGWGLGLAHSPLIFWFSFVLVLCASMVSNLSSFHLFYSVLCFCSVQEWGE